MGFSSSQLLWEEMAMFKWLEYLILIAFGIGAAVWMGAVAVLKFWDVSDRHQSRKRAKAKKDAKKKGGVPAEAAK